MKERSDLMEWLRGEVIGPARGLLKPDTAKFTNGEFVDSNSDRRGGLVWKPDNQTDTEEVLYFNRETPNRKYGAGLLYPEEGAFSHAKAALSPSEMAMQANDTIGVDIALEDENESKSLGASSDDSDNFRSDETDASSDPDDFAVTSADLRYPSTLGISLSVQLDNEGQIIVHLPRSRRFSWQDKGAPPFQLNGRYESCKRRWSNGGQPQESQMWRRYPAIATDCEVVINRNELVSGKRIRHKVPASSPLDLVIDVFPRYREMENTWLLTVVLRNHTSATSKEDVNKSILYQSYFEVFIKGGVICKYPESQLPFARLDEDEQSLALLYRESATWGIGHGCAAGWDAEPDETPESVYADVMPAVQLPSMTPDIKNSHGQPIRLAMKDLARLSDGGDDPAWQSLEDLASEYHNWIQRGRQQIASGLAPHYLTVASRHLDNCEECLSRIRRGIVLLRTEPRVRYAFRLANLAMLLQQIATKQLKRRSLHFDERSGRFQHKGESFCSPWDIYAKGKVLDGVGMWRAFQIAFLLMSLEGVHDGVSPDREIVDLIWFPTGGGKTEAYLAVMAFYMFHERLKMNGGDQELPRDGVNVLMRYTLRMLTTQQFQRAASLICAMEFLRRNPDRHCIVGNIPGRRFSLGLWIGNDAAPNTITDAKSRINKYRQGKIAGNPLVLTECPWCRTQIGLCEGSKPRGRQSRKRLAPPVAGIEDVSGEGPLLCCPDNKCPFGQEKHKDWLPIEVIDERIYRKPPSLIIGTADKFAIVAYRPKAGAIFGRDDSNTSQQCTTPPGLIIQDELHLISGPLGTMYALYEGVFERLCSCEQAGVIIRPKIIASTATIRGAADQVKSLYARVRTNLFPSPRLTMGDSFFGTYARNKDGHLLPGRMYLGLHAGNYGSILTTQVRTFSSALACPWTFDKERRDPWWTLLVFYNSIRELGGARTLFDSDIRSRLKFLFNREGYKHDERRNLRIVEELTARLSQSEIVEMMDDLSQLYASDGVEAVDACLASNIIEVGVDIDRLSLMAVVGQPKTTATYIQVTGRVGRRWWERPGLILMLYNPSKSRDRSHFEQFHSYHRRLYERVEPTSATPFALSAIRRALPGALLTWARQQSDADVYRIESYADAVRDIMDLLQERCRMIQPSVDVERSLQEMERVHADLMHKWKNNPQKWEEYPPATDGEYLMLWPGQYASESQKARGVTVPSSMRQVDRTGNLKIDQEYMDSGTAP